jgi:hypothetical protein
LDSGSGQGLPQSLSSILVGQGCELGPEAKGNLRQCSGIAPAHNGLDTKLLPVSQDHVCCRTTD